MPYTAAQLTAYYTALTGLAPDAATSVLYQAYSTQNFGGSLTDAATLALVFNGTNVQATFEVIEATYQFFTGAGVSAGGLAFLRGDAGAGNANGLNSAYYTQFNLENRYYNFAVNLTSAAGAGNAAFTAAYGTLTVAQTITAAYETIVGTSNVGAAAAAAAIADINSRIAYFTQVAQQRAGGVDAGGAVGANIALKSIIVGYILEEANKADIGTYAKAIDQLEASVAAGNAIYGQNILTVYGPGGIGYNTGVGLTTTTGTGGSTVALTTGTDVFNATVGNVNYIGLVNNTAGSTNSTLTAQDVINAQGANNTLIVDVVGGGDASGGAILNNIQTVDVRNTTAALATFNQTASTSTTAFNGYLSAGAVTFNNLQANSILGVIGNGSAGGGFIQGNYATGVATANVQVVNGTTAGSGVGVAGASLVTVNLTSTGAANALAGGLGLGTATTLNINAATALAIGATTATALATIAVTNPTTAVALGYIGTGGVSLSPLGTGYLTPDQTIRTITAGNGGFTAAFGANTTGTLSVTTGTGVDAITIGNFLDFNGTTGAFANGNLLASTNINLGGGGDSLTVNGTIAAGATLTGGGNATLTTGQASFSALTGFTVAQRALITGFSTVGIVDALASGVTYDVNTIGATNFRTIGVAGFAPAAGATTGTANAQTYNTGTGFFTNAGSATLNTNTNTTVTISGSGGATTVGGDQLNQGGFNIALANAVTNTNDVLNIAYTGQGTTAVGNATFSQIATVGVETINVTATRAAGAAATSVINLSLSDFVLKTLTVAGNENFNFSTNTASFAGPYVAYGQLTTITSTSTGVATIDVSTNVGYLSGSNFMSVTTGSAADTITVKDFVRVTGGAGVTTINDVQATNGQSYSSLLDGKAGDIINFTNGAVMASQAVQAKIVLNATAVFQDYLDAATGSAHNTTGEVNSFDFGGNTYIVVNDSAALTFQNGTDQVIQLVGIHTIGSVSATSQVILGS